MKKSFLLFCILILFPLTGQAAEKPVWVEAAGEALLGDADTPKEVKDRAKRDAQSKAVEKAVGVFIKSHTVVSNFQLADDLIYAAIRGKIKKSETLREGWDEKDRNLYHIRIRALVDPVYPEKDRGFFLKTALSTSLLKADEEVRIFYQSNTECYVYIFSIAADGSVTVLFPNSLSKDNHVLSDKTYEFPPAGSALKLKAGFLPDFKGKTAEERIKIIATKREEAIVPLGFQEGMFKVYDAKSTGMISDLIRKLNQIDPADWAEATTAYQIVR